MPLQKISSFSSRKPRRVAKRAKVFPKNTLAAWTKEVDRLLERITHWSESKGWPVARQEKELSEEAFGRYFTSDLNIKVPGGWLVVDVQGRDIVGADGRVDLYSFPSLRRMLLIRQHGKWLVKTDEGITWPVPWGEAAFVDLARQLTSPL